MLSLAVVISLRNLPLTAEYGLASIFFYAVAAIFFMVPYGLVSAELASAWPKGGGVFIWVKEALGERWGFVAIFLQWFHNMTWYPVMLAFVGAGLAYLFMPELAQNRFYLLACILVGFWGITFLNFLGIKISSWVSTLFLLLGTIFPGIVLILFALLWIILQKPIDIELSAAALMPDLTSFTNIVFLAGAFLALTGLEANANLAREVKNPQKNYPKAILFAALMALGILVFGTLSIAIVVPHGHISLVSGLLDAFTTFFRAVHAAWLFPIIAICTILGALGELNAWTIAGAKGFFATSEYGLLPPYLHKTNAKFIPTRLLVIQALLVTVAAVIFLFYEEVSLAYWVLSALSAAMYLVMYILLLTSGLVLRYKKPRTPRLYKIPGGNAGIWACAVVGTISCLFALFVSFFPPSQHAVTNLVGYELVQALGLGASIALPLILYALRKPSWQLRVLAEIREEIHLSTH